MGVGFIRDGKGGCGFYKRRERWVWVSKETGMVGVGFIRDGKGGCGFYKRPEGWV